MSSSDSEAGNVRYVRMLMDARDNVRQWIAECTQHFEDPKLAIRDSADPRRKGHVRLHTAIMDYFDQIRLYRESLSKDDWKGEVARFTVAGAEQSVSLANLEDYRYEHIVRSEHSRGDARGSTATTVQYRVLLPLETVTKLYNHIDECVADLEFVPVRGQGNRVQIDEELLDEANDYINQIKEDDQ